MASPTMRPSPFARPTTPSTVRAQSPQPQPAPCSPQQQQPSSPMRSPERQQSPFIRRPSQLGSPQRAKSPFAARPPSRLNVTETSQDDDDDDLAPPQIDTAIPFKLSPALAPTNISQPPNPSQASHAPSRPTPHRTVTASSTTTVRPLPSTAPTSTTARPRLGAYSHVPQALMHTLRESFEVLDTGSKGHLTPSDLAIALEQLGHTSIDDVAGSSSLQAYFPSSSTTTGGAQDKTLPLSKFLDGLVTPMKGFCAPEELAAAFAAFDVDDSGQIEVGELREAVLDAARAEGSDGGGAVSGQMVDGILEEFRGRRAFGAKGVLGKDLGAANRGDVFRYRDFMSAITGAGTATA